MPRKKKSVKKKRRRVVRLSQARSALSKHSRTRKKTSLKRKKVAKKFIGGTTFRKKRFNLVSRNLVLFVIMFILSFVLYNVSTAEIYVNLFLLLSIILGFVSVAFLIILLALVFMKWFKK